MVLFLKTCRRDGTNPKKSLLDYATELLEADAGLDLLARDGLTGVRVA
jgi:hypothetical protein